MYNFLSISICKSDIEFEKKFIHASINIFLNMISVTVLGIFYWSVAQIFG